MGGGGAGQKLPPKNLNQVYSCDCTVVVIELTCGLIHVASHQTKIPR